MAGIPLDLRDARAGEIRHTRRGRADITARSGPPRRQRALGRLAATGCVLLTGGVLATLSMQPTAPHGLAALAAAPCPANARLDFGAGQPVAVTASRPLTRLPVVARLCRYAPFGPLAFDLVLNTHDTQRLATLINDPTHVTTSIGYYCAADDGARDLLLFTAASGKVSSVIRTPHGCPTLQSGHTERDTPRAVADYLDQALATTNSANRQPQQPPASP
jgi:hypothetical protein